MLVADLIGFALEMNIAPSVALKAISPLETRVAVHRGRLGKGDGRGGEKDKREHSAKAAELCGHSEAAPVKI